MIMLYSNDAKKLARSATFAEQSKVWAGGDFYCRFAL